MYNKCFQNNHNYQNHSKKVKCNKKRLLLCFSLLLFFTLSTGCPDLEWSPDPEYVIQSTLFLESLQQQRPSGLIPIAEDSAYTTTYSNAVAAIALIREDRIAAARRILDVFAAQTDPSPLTGLSGGFQQHREAETGGPITDVEVNDFWIGDNAWLLVALNCYKEATRKKTYNTLAGRLVGWIRKIWENTEGGGIYGGFDKDGNFISQHAEGSIDVYGALRGHDAEDIRQSIKNWLDANVWIPDGGCYARGLQNEFDLPTDHVSWGYTALLHADDDYACIIDDAIVSNQRIYNPFLLESFDHDPGAYWNHEENTYWMLDTSHDTVQVGLERINNGNGYDLSVVYTCSPDQWFRLYRHQDINLAISDDFRYSFLVKGDGSNCRLEVKLQDVSNKAYCYNFNLDFTDWRLLEIPYNQLIPFDPENTDSLTQIGQIEFALNNSTGADISDNNFILGNIYYTDSTAAFQLPVSGFSAFQWERNRIFIEGTCQMLSAFSAAGRTGDWQNTMAEVNTLFIPPVSGIGLGLPGSLYAGNSNPWPESVATAWYIIGAECLNPFWPEDINIDQ